MALLAVGPAGCALAVPEPEGEAPAALGVSLRENWAVWDWFEEQPEMVYFIRLGEGEDFTRPAEVLRSNYFRDHRLYLLNARPGRYAMVASSEFVQHPASPGGGPAVMPAGCTGCGARPAALPAAMPRFNSGDRNERRIYTSYFSEALVRQSVVEVPPGRMTVMGAFRVKRHTGVHRVDPVQRHYLDTLVVDLVDPYGYPILNDDSDYSVASRGEPAEVRREKAAVSAFLREALEDFRGTPWEAVVRRSLRAAAGR